MTQANVHKAGGLKAAGLKLITAGVLTITVWTFSSVSARESPAPSQSNSQTISLSELPTQGAQTYQLILQGGPFPHEKDGVVFGNRERQLPAKKRGFYREYTVTTPGARNRGVKRIVCGGPAKTPNDCFYTADHYASFRRIVP